MNLAEEAQVLKLVLYSWTLCNTREQIPPGGNGALRVCGRQKKTRLIERQILPEVPCAKGAFPMLCTKSIFTERNYVVLQI